MLQSYSSILSSSDALLSLEDINYAQYERMDRLRDDELSYLDTLKLSYLDTLIEFMFDILDLYHLINYG